MDENLKFVIDETKGEMQKTITHLIDTLSKIRAGKASTQMLAGISIDYYGTKTPLNQTANLSAPDPKTIAIQPWDKSMIEAIEKSIMAANLGFNPQNDGEIIRINIPPLTEERRKQLAKYINTESENNKVSLRNARKNANDSIKEYQDEGASEDDAKRAEKEVQEITNEYTKKIEEITKKKEEDIMKV